MDQHNPADPLGKGKTVLQGNPQSSKSMMKNCLIWNSRESNKVEFRRYCQSLVSIHQPSILALLETRISDHRGLADELGFLCFLQSSTTGSSEVIVIYQKDDVIAIKDISISSQAIHATIKVSSPPSCQILRVIYASNVFSIRRSFWDQLMCIDNSLHTLDSDSWLVGGDFNEILKASKKLRGNSIKYARSALFWDQLNHYNIIDLIFRGSKFTWSNEVQIYTEPHLGKIRQMLSK